MKKYKKLLAAALAICSISTVANAASYQLNDYSVTNMGRSYAGQGIVGDDYSAIAYNPAGMTLMKKSGVQQVFNVIGVESDVYGINDKAGEKGEMKFWQAVPAGFAQYNANDKLSLGVGIYAPFGLKTRYKYNWFGNDAAILSKLDIVDFNLSAAYKLDEHWSIGASAIMRYIYGRMTQRVTNTYGDINFNVHGWSQTGTLGLMYEFDETARVGLSYRLRSAQRAKGTYKTSAIPPIIAEGGYDVNANPDLPETVTFSAYKRIKNIGFSGTARWTHWTSSFPDFSVRSEGIPLTGEKKSLYNYQNTWALAVGADFYYTKETTFRVGAGYDESPTHKPDRRSYRIPDSDRWWLSAGASYAVENWQFDVAYAHLFAKTSESTADATVVGATPTAKYKHTFSNIIGAQVQYSF
ncbi:MAG: transporter [Alphaproteobacteria bacterium]|nr:transporter [Alphaproteobacteria bacterium]